MMTKKKFDMLASQIDAALASTPADADKASKMCLVEDDMEAVAFQMWQAEYHAAGFLELELAMWLYNAFGRELPSAKKINNMTFGQRYLVHQLIMITRKGAAAKA